MPITGNWIFTASMDVDADKEALLNEVYDEEHIPQHTLHHVMGASPS